MPMVGLPALPDHGRLWVFPASRRLAVDEHTSKPSGCSIDALVNRQEFRALADEGTVGPDTLVFDTSLTCRGSRPIQAAPSASARKRAPSSSPQ